MNTPLYRSDSVELICDTPEVRIAEIALAAHSETPEHVHTHAPEICYCLSGELTVEGAGPAPLVLRAGEKKRFEAGSAHQLVNRSAATCRFLLIHAGGKFDFVSR